MTGIQTEREGYMRAISINQPYATLIERGQKTLEVRSWRTKIRGSVLVCSTKLPYYNDLPRGQALCVVDIVNCRAFLPEDAFDAECDFVEGYFVWELKNVRKIQRFPVKGKQGFFEVTTTVKELS